MSKNIAIVNQKGGTGKTLTTLNLSHGLTLQGKKVLMIDLDPQGSLTSILLRQPINKSVIDLMRGKEEPEDYIFKLQDKKNLFLLPSDSRLAKIEKEQQKGREFLLKRAMIRLKGFDFIIVDCGPSLGLLTIVALVFADHIIIPVKTDYLSLQGLVKINDLIEIVKESLNPDLKNLGYLPCQYDKRRVLDREVFSLLKKRFKNVLNPIRQNISLGESPSWGQSIFEYKEDSKGAEDYQGLVKAILRG